VPQVSASGQALVSIPDPEHHTESMHALRLAATLLVALAAPVVAADQPALAKATFAGGCFWCMEPPFEALDGVVSVTSGYTGGTKVDPTYEEVSAGGTGHAESIEVAYDPGKVSYEKLLVVFWHNVDPTTANRQFCDKGNQYRTAIFYHDETQKRLAEQSKQALEASKKLPGLIVTEIVPAGRFYPAEEYHQDYSKKNPIRYNYYRWGCGRDARLKEVWGAEAPAH
jgi:peptide-methionine (S)-S-oxide reductase